MAVNVIYNGLIWGMVIICLVTLLKSIIEFAIGRFDKVNKWLYIILSSCNTCITFWVVLALSFNLYYACIAWCTASIISRFSK